jgi:hypothetical protein
LAGHSEEVLDLQGAHELRLCLNVRDIGIIGGGYIQKAGGIAPHVSAPMGNGGSESISSRAWLSVAMVRPSLSVIGVASLRDQGIVNSKPPGGERVESGRCAAGRERRCRARTDNPSGQIE